jgi:hypothetical protein
MSSKIISGAGIQTISAPKKGPGLQQPTMSSQPDSKRRRAACRAASRRPTPSLQFRKICTYLLYNLYPTDIDFEVGWNLDVRAPCTEMRSATGDVDPRLGEARHRRWAFSSSTGPIWNSRGRSKIGGACFWRSVGFIIGFTSRTDSRAAISLLSPSPALRPLDFRAWGTLGQSFQVELDDPITRAPVTPLLVAASHPQPGTRQPKFLGSAFVLLDKYLARPAHLPKASNGADLE